MIQTKPGGQDRRQTQTHRAGRSVRKKRGRQSRGQIRSNVEEPAHDQLEHKMRKKEKGWKPLK